MKFLTPIEWQHHGTARAEGERVRDGQVEACDEDDRTPRQSTESKPEQRASKPVAPVRPSQPKGITVVELMVVLAIIAIMMGLGAYAMGSLGNGDLRADAGAVTAAIKYTYANAAINNTEYRLVFSLDTGTYQSEVVQTAAVQTTSSSATNGGEDFLTEEAQRLADKVEKEHDLFADEEDNPFGINRKVTYQRVEDGVLKKTKLKTGNRFAKMVKGNSDEEYTDGKVSMTFFPNGFQEQVMIVLEDEKGAKITLVTEPLTGRVLTYTGTDELPEGFGEVEDDD